MPYQYIDDDAPVLSFYDAIVEIGAAANLVVCLDAGDAASYDGTSQTWVDTSGLSNSYFLGTNNTVAGNDPAFNGTAGDLSDAEYFSFDGGDQFQETSSQTFAEGATSWNGTSGAFTILAVLSPADYSVNQAIWANRPHLASARGVIFDIAITSGRLRLRISGDASTDGVSTTASAGFEPLVNTPNFVGVTYTHTGGGPLNFYLNGAQDARTDTLSGGSNTAPTNANMIASAAGALSRFTNGSRLWGVVLASRVWSPSEVDAFYQAIKSRFPAMP